MESKRSEAVRDHWHSMTKAASANPDQSPEEVPRKGRKILACPDGPSPVASTTWRSRWPACPRRAWSRREVLRIE